jgi:hypothetical protein
MFKNLSGGLQEWRLIADINEKEKKIISQIWTKTRFQIVSKTDEGIRNAAI